MQTWVSCKPQKTLPACTHWSTTIPSWKMAVHEGAFMPLFTRQSGGQRVSPRQNSEDTQQQFSRAHPCSIKAFLLHFCPWLMWENIPGPLPLYHTVSDRKLGEGLGTRLQTKQNKLISRYSCNHTCKWRRNQPLMRKHNSHNPQKEQFEPVGVNAIPSGECNIFVGCYP